MSFKLYLVELPGARIGTCMDTRKDVRRIATRKKRCICDGRIRGTDVRQIGYVQMLVRIYLYPRKNVLNYL